MEGASIGGVRKSRIKKVLRAILNGFESLDLLGHWVVR